METITTMKLKKEWTEKDFKTMEKAIERYFSRRSIFTSHGEYILKVHRSFNQLDKIMGFAYTSSGDCAGYWICNVDVTYNLPMEPERRYVGFVMDENNTPFALLWDKEENEKYIAL